MFFFKIAFPMRFTSGLNYLQTRVITLESTLVSKAAVILMMMSRVKLIFMPMSRTHKKQLLVREE